MKDFRRDILKFDYSITIIVVSLIMIGFSSCTHEKGYVYMPNMYISPSLETYDDKGIDGKSIMLPVKGTIARGYMPFEYDESLAGYLEAGRELNNPISLSEENLQKGEALYGMFCKHCHGNTGGGDGTIKHPVYSAIPAYNDDKMIRRTGGTMLELKDGHIYHTITYGLNAMGPHASQLSSEERWQIVYYVREELQKKEE